MKTVFSRLAAFAIALSIAILLFAPMRAGVEDLLKASISEIEMEIGENAKIDYALYAETAQTVAYESEDPGIAAVDPSGMVTAVSPGITNIRLTAQQGATDWVKVTVSGVPITSFTLNTPRLELDKGEVSGLSCIFNTGVTDRRVEWMSADPSVVRVDAAGRVTAVGAGETYVVATTPGGFSAAATVCVRVRGTAVQIVPEELKVGVGATLPLSVRYLPEDTTDVVSGWNSNRPEVLTIDETGMIRAVSVGTAVVTVRSRDGLVGSTTVTVEPAAKDLQINPTDLVIERGEAFSLEAWFIGSNGMRDDTVNHHIEWTTSDATVATVENGVVTAVRSGIAYITASADGIRAVCTVRVETSVHEVSLNMNEMYLLREQTGEAFQLKAAVIPADADVSKVTFTSDNRLVATVTADGLVTLTGGYGSATITATAASGAQDVFRVHVVTELPETVAEEIPESAVEETASAAGTLE